MTYRCSEVADKTGVSKRTVHYYVTMGLIPPPEGTGAAAKYSDVHINKILQIKALQNDYLPLSKIKEILESQGQKKMNLSWGKSERINDDVEIKFLIRDVPDSDTLEKMEKVISYAKSIFKSERK